jgi:hypothetical protein
MIIYLVVVYIMNQKYISPSLRNGVIALLRDTGAWCACDDDSVATILGMKHNQPGQTRHFHTSFISL